MKLLLERSEHTSPDQLDQFASTLRDAIVWSRRKANDGFILLLDDALAHTSARRHSSFDLIDETTFFLGGRNNNRRASSLSTDVEADDSSLGNGDHHGIDGGDDRKVKETEAILEKAETLREETICLASRLEHIKLRSEHEMSLVMMDFEETQRKLCEAEQLSERRARVVEEAREQMEIARSVFEATHEQYNHEQNEFVVCESRLTNLREKFISLQARKQQLEDLRDRVASAKINEFVKVECRSCSRKERENEQGLECPICRDEKVNRSFNCGHALCKECTRRIHDAAGRRAASPGSGRQDVVKAKCPICKATIETIHPLFL